MKLHYIVILSLSVSSLFSQQTTVYDDSTLKLKIMSLAVTEEEYLSKVPSQFGKNLLFNAKCIYCNQQAAINTTQKLFDDNPFTTWESRKYTPRPVLIIDIGRRAKFNKLVIFNKFTDSKGSGGGNNALKNISLYIADSNQPENFRKIDDYELHGHIPRCFTLKNGLHFCMFFNDPEPNIFEFRTSEARYLKFVLNEAFWSRFLPDSLWTNIALSEIMLFYKE